MKSEAMLAKSPYKGLESFKEDDHDMFFGRDKQISQVISYLKAFRITILYGGSGVGKSSLLRAGVVHEIRAETRGSLAERQLPGQVVLVFPPAHDVSSGGWEGDVVGRLLGEVEASVRELHPEAPPPPASLSFTQALRYWAKKIRSDEGGTGRIFLILDQFEEFLSALTPPLSPQHQQFLEALASAITSFGLPVNFVISVRQSAFTQLDRFKQQIPGLMDKRIEIRPINRDGAREAIEQPLQVLEGEHPEARIELDPQLVSSVLQIVRNEKGDEVEAPYLQLIMKTLWDRASSRGCEQISLDDLRAMGGSPQASPKDAARCIVAQHFHQQISPQDRDLASALFDCLVTRTGRIIPQQLEALEDAVLRDSELASKFQDLQEIRQLLERWSHESSRLLRVWEGNRYEIYFQVLADVIAEWLRTCAEVDRLRQQAAGAEERFRTSQLDALGQGYKAAARFLDLVARAPAENWLEDPGAVQVMHVLQTTLESRREIWRSPPLQDPRHPGDHQNPLYGLALHPGGRWLATGYFDGTVILWDLDEQPASEHVRFVDPAGTLINLQFSPGGDWLATVSASRTVRLWSVSDSLAEHPGGGAQQTRIPAPGALLEVSTGVMTVAIGAGARPLLATASFDREIAVYEQLSSPERFEKRGAIHPFQKPLQFPLSLAFDGVGSLLEIQDSEGGLIFWDWESDDFWTFYPSNDTGSAERFPGLSSPSTERVTGAMDGSIHGWQFSLPLPAKQPVESIALDSSQVIQAFLHGSFIYVIQADGVVRRWDRQQRRADSFATNQTPVFRAFLRERVGDAPQLLTLSATSRAHLWDLSEDLPLDRTDELIRVVYSSSLQVSCVDVSPDGRWMACLLFQGDALHRCEILPQGGVGAVTTVPATNLQEVQQFTRARYCRHGGWLALAGFAAAANGGDIHLVALHDPSTLRREARCQEHNDFIYSLDTHPTEPLVATASADGTFCLWNWEERRAVFHSPPLQEGGLFSIAFAPDGERLAVSTTSGGILLFDVSGLRASAPGTCPDPQRCIGHQSAVFGIAFAPDGDLLASASAEGTVRLWDRQGTCRQDLPHASTVYCVCFSPDGRLLASGSADGTVNLWRRCRDQWIPSGTFRHHRTSVFSLCFLPDPLGGSDSPELLTASADGTVKLRRLEPPQALVDRAAATLRRAGSVEGG